ncbi:diguanylate cyclase [Tahibacter amnicola]|uniref:diguanylate cyclase n=1 Tax=Tahibacter amnicola TaxID=2976241 RepID=A0ABY6BAK8_9GAMM|nr:diguanylate cyclase [Tahibacter amnicola]UXI67103.1 diguanylate cyclase [Tahibacter amnicola]
MPETDPTLSTRARHERQLALIHRVARIATETSPLRQKLQQIVVLLKQHMGCEFVACVSIDAQAGRFRCEAMASDLPTVIHVGYSRELGSGVVGEVAATGQRIYVADVAEHPNYVETMPGTRSELCVAIRYNSEVMGALNAESARTHAFADSIDLLITIAEQVAGILAASRLNDEQRRRVEFLGMLSELSRAASEAEGLNETLHRIVHFFRDRFALETSAMMLVDDAGERLRLNSHAGASVFQGRSGGDWPSNLGVIGRAFRTGQAIYVPDVAEDPDYVLGNPSVVSEFVLPVRHHGRFIGLLNLETSNVDSFNDANRQMLSALAEQVAGAIHLASTNERLREINRLVQEKSAALAQANHQLLLANGQLEKLSNLDGLTGIANRRRFDKALHAEWHRALRHNRPLSLLLIDVDEFKSFNDGNGHLAGDDALRRLAGALSEGLSRGEDLVARYGGEEFAVLLPETGIDDAIRVAEHLQRAVAELAVAHGHSAHSSVLTLSIGINSLMPSETDLIGGFVERADRALYRAKAMGRNRIECAD